MASQAREREIFNTSFVAIGCIVDFEYGAEVVALLFFSFPAEQLQISFPVLFLTDLVEN